MRSRRREEEKEREEGGTGGAYNYTSVLLCFSSSGTPTNSSILKLPVLQTER